jgi:hypothetical protein
MRIESSKGDEISNLDEWAALYDTPKKRIHWKPQRSAYSTAEFILNHNGAAYLQDKVSKLVGENVTLERAVPEYEQRFDAFGHGREHDLGIFGSTSAGKSVFVGLEAKVDETFGALVKDAYSAARARESSGKNTNAPERIERLLALHFAESTAAMWDVRYQLLYATAGTVAAGADISVLYVLVFRTGLYNAGIGESNQRDYQEFIELAGGKDLAFGSDACTHELMLDGKRLFCSYETVDLYA